MARPADPLKSAAIADLLKHLRAGVSPDLARTRYATVNKVTWWRWVQEAQTAFKSEGGAPPPAPAALPAPPSADRPAPARKQGGKKARGRTTAKPEPAKRGRGVKQQAAEILPPAIVPNGLGTLSDDGETYMVTTMFGTKESSVLRGFGEDSGDNPHDALRLVERVGKQYENAAALMNAAIKRIDGGHVIIDPQSFAAGIDLQIKSQKLLHAVLKDARSLDSVRRFLDIVVELLKKEEAGFATRVSALLRAAAKDFVPFVGNS